MRRRGVQAVLAVTLLGLLAAPAYSDDWPRWRGPAGNGISAESDWNPEALANGARVLWRAEVGMGHSAIAVADGRLYVIGNRPVSNGPATGKHEDLVYCLDATSGREIWRFSYPCKAGKDPGPGSSPVLDGDSLYTFGREGQLICFNAVDGTVRWRRDIAAEAAPDWGFAGSPMIEGDLVLLDAGTSGYGVDKHSGRVIWSSETEPCGYATPVVYTSDGQRRAVIAGRRQVVAVDIATGEIQWSHRSQALNDPILFGDQVLLSGAGVAEMLKIGEAEPESVWRQRGLLSHYSTPVVFGEFVYGIARGTGTYELQSVDLHSGELRWSQAIGEWGALIGAAGKLIVIDDRGRLLIVEATPEAYRLISSAKVLAMADNTGLDRRHQCHCWTAPTLANGLVYVRNTFGELACVDLR